MLTAEDLKRVYAAYTSARWRGEPAEAILEHWFGVHWVETSPCEPETDAAAVSPHGAGGRGIYWHECGSAVLGFAPGRSGCYVVKQTESLPDISAPRPVHAPVPPRMQTVAHFQAGTYARHLSLSLTSPEPSKD